MTLCGAICIEKSLRPPPHMTSEVSKSMLFFSYFVSLFCYTYSQVIVCTSVVFLLIRQQTNLVQILLDNSSGYAWQSQTEYRG
jgi:hypothetical protein